MRRHALQSLLVTGVLCLSACAEGPITAPTTDPFGEQDAFDRPPPEARRSPPIPAIGPVPSVRQLAYQRMETNAFIHFGPNTFQGIEWGDGTASPDVFAPTALDARQWASVLAETGFRGVVMVAKHHDGFLLWPSPLSDYTVAQSPWRGGEGDLVREVADAVHDAGLRLGFYLSPWDRNHPSWGTPAYNDYFVATLGELVDRSRTPPFEIWFDGAHGPEVTQDQRDAYDNRRWNEEVRRIAPEAVIALSTDVFWPGNEEGYCPTTNWSVRDDHPRWAPYETDTTIRTRTHWFWSPADEPRSLIELVDVYFGSVGRGCTLLLNVPPDTRGLITDEDADRLREWRRAIDDIFREDLAYAAEATASSVRNDAHGWDAGATVDGDPDSFWSTADSTGWVEIDFGDERYVNVVELAEPIRYGQRVASFRLDAWDGARWTTAARGTTIGYKRLLRFAPVRARRWRVVVEAGRAAPALSQIGLYAAPDWSETWASTGLDS